MSNEILSFTNVTVLYDAVLPKLDDVSFSVSAGEFVFLTGVSGSGKTTVLNLIYKLINPDTGHVIFDGSDVHSKKVPTARHRSQIGYVFQYPNLLENRTVRYNVSLPLRIAGEAGPPMNLKIEDALTQCCISDLSEQKTILLSGGEKQLVSLARALVTRPKIVLADEPTANLDRKMSLTVLNLLLRINEGGTTVILCTHDAELIKVYSSRILLIKKGKVSDYRSR